MNIHARAEQLVRESGGRLTMPEALAELGRRGASKQNARKVSGVLHPMRADRSAFDAVESPRLWWLDRD